MTQQSHSNEFQRLIALSDYDLDYSELEKQFEDLVNLAAKVAGSQISLVNIIDNHTQWSIAASGLPTMQMDRNDAVCNYTIMGEENFEVKDLSIDPRFKDKFYVSGEPNLKYYWGVPLRTKEGFNLGALCVMDSQTKELSAEKVDLLQMIGKEVVNRLEVVKTMHTLKEDLQDIKQNQKKVAHDIRGPLAGIVGLAEMIQLQGDQNTLDDILEFISLIQKSGRSLLELADQIMKNEDGTKDLAQNKNTFNLYSLKQKLLDLYAVQARQKDIFFTVSVVGDALNVSFPKTKILQIIGNIISNALKFTHVKGAVSVTLSLEKQANRHYIQIQVRDTGEGISQAKIDEIIEGGTNSTSGTGGETGYGFGLSLVKYLVDSLQGKLSIESELGKYSLFTIVVPV
jgi:signal transduction histidine kinase